MRRSNFRGVRDGADVANLNVQTFVDCRLVASIGKFLLEHGQIAQTQYGRISTYCMRYFMQMLEDNYPDSVTRFEDTSEAIQWLGANGFSLAQFKSGSNNRLIATVRNEHALQDDLGSFFQPITPPRQTQQVAESVVNLFSPDEIRKLETALTQGERVARNSTPEMQAHFAEVRARTEKDMPEMLEQMETRCAPVSEEVRQQNMRQSAIVLMLKNATSSQQMPVPKELLPFMTDPDVLAEVEAQMQPYLEQRERDMVEAERNKQRQAEEKARRQVG